MWLIMTLPRYPRLLHTHYQSTTVNMSPLPQPPQSTTTMSSFTPHMVVVEWLAPQELELEPRNADRLHQKYQWVLADQLAHAGWGSLRLSSQRSNGNRSWMSWDASGTARWGRDKSQEWSNHCSSSACWGHVHTALQHSSVHRIPQRSPPAGLGHSATAWTAEMPRRTCSVRGHQQAWYPVNNNKWLAGWFKI